MKWDTLVVVVLLPNLFSASRSGLKYSYSKDISFFSGIKGEVYSYRREQ